MKIYTKTGDTGETALFGGQRVRKDSQRIAAYGTVDELNAQIGLALCDISNGEVKELLTEIQNTLFTVGADLATPGSYASKNKTVQRISPGEAERLEKKIDHFEEKLEPLKAFILPGGARGAAVLHIARTVCRRAEREVVAIPEEEEINQHIVIYLNRLSDLLFVLARVENHTSGNPDVKWRQ